MREPYTHDVADEPVREAVRAHDHGSESRDEQDQRHPPRPRVAERDAHVEQHDAHRGDNKQRSDTDRRRDAERHSRLERFAVDLADAVGEPLGEDGVAPYGVDRWPEPGALQGLSHAYGVLGPVEGRFDLVDRHHAILHETSVAAATKPSASIDRPGGNTASVHPPPSETTSDAGGPTLIVCE